MLLSLIAFAVATVALAGDTPEGEDTPPVVIFAPEAELESAISDYLNGDLETARLTLIRLAHDPRLANRPVLRQRARIYLGEVLYVMGDRVTCWEMFRAVAREAPDYRMDPFVHPPEVVTYYESARESIKVFDQPSGGDATNSTTTTRALLPPMPWALLPGRLQFHNAQPALGYVAIGSVVLSTSTTFGLSSYIRAQDDYPYDPNNPQGTRGVNLHPSETDGQQDFVNTLIVLKSVRNYTAIATGGLWAAAVLQGTLRASRAASVPVVTVLPTQGGEGAAATLTVVW